MVDIGWLSFIYQNHLKMQSGIRHLTHQRYKVLHRFCEDSVKITDTSLKTGLRSFGRVMDSRIIFEDGFFKDSASPFLNPKTEIEPQ
jgi:hypothetical protein